MTVLSRCLQFNLKQMPPGHIVSHLDNILGQEGIAFETPALRLLAQGAHGSLGDLAVSGHGLRGAVSARQVAAHDDVTPRLPVPHETVCRQDAADLGRSQRAELRHAPASRVARAHRFSAGV